MGIDSLEEEAIADLIDDYVRTALFIIGLACVAMIPVVGWWGVIPASWAWGILEIVFGREENNETT